MNNNQQSNLVDAFKRFQLHCEVLEATHIDLRKQIANAQLQLEEKNRELAKKMEETERIKNRLFSTFESISDAILMVDSEAKIELANRAAEQLLGKKIVGGKLLQYLPQLSVCLHDDIVKNMELTLNKNGQEQILIINSMPITSTKSLYGAKVLAIRDITEHRNLQIRVAREDRLAALGQVAANVAHEVRNPLGAIEGFARLLQQDLKEYLPNSEPLAEKIVYASHQLNGVVSNLLNYARGIYCNFQKIDLMLVLNQVLELIRPMAEDTKVELNISGDTPIAITADIVQIRQVLSNLLINAVEACPVRKGGKVNIEFKNYDGYVKIIIKDNGCGIAVEHQKRVFEPFFTMKNGGVGLGLAMCKRIVESHNGTIKVKSMPQKGTTFTLTLSKEQK